ncbi:hypothetical protein [Chitinophaga sp.]|uniref:hypothetical protein n=1 Tax=Chitinophaga sp. TaxID=1869181 RepID=UPI002F95DDD4
MKTIAIGLLLLCCLGAVAQTDSLSHKKHKPTPPWYVDRFRISAGFFIPFTHTDVSVGNTSGTKGTNISFENTLGYANTNFTFLGDFQWRASRRSRFDLAYYRVARSAGHVLDKEITFGEHTYPVNAATNSYFNTDIFRFSYGYALLCKPRAEAGIMIGAHIVKAGVGLAAVTNVGSVAVTDDYGFTAPLPDVGIWGGYTFAERWAVTAEVSYLGLTVDNIKGRIIAANAQVMYRIIQRFSVTAGYTGFNFNVEATRKNLVGELVWGYNGPSLTATWSFGHKPW